MTHIIGRGRYAREGYPQQQAPNDDHKVLVNIDDVTPDYLQAKIIPGSGVLVTPVDLGGGFFALSIAANVPPGTSDHKVLVDGADTTAEFLGAKLVAGAAIAFSVLNPGGNEQINIAVSNLANAQVAAGANIEVTKLAPGSNGQVLVTAGVTPGWAQIVNANVAVGAAILGTKISPDFGSQNVLTSGTLGAGATTVTALTASSLGAGIAHIAVGGAFSSSLIVNADVNAAAAIEGTKISPNFGAQDVQTTGNLFLTKTSYIRLGSAAETPALGNFRVSDQFEMYGRMPTGVAARLLFFDATGDGILALGRNNANDADLTRVQAKSRIRLELSDGATQYLDMTVPLIQMGSAFTNFNWNAAVVDPIFGVASKLVGNGTLLTIHGQDAEAAGATAGALLNRGGDSVGGGASTGGDIWDRPGTGTTRGNHAFMTTSIPAWGSMQFGAFWGNATVAPTGNPTSGHYSYVSGGARFHRGPSGAITMVSTP